MRIDNNLFKTGAFGSGVNTGNIAINPRHHGAERIMVVGIHRGVAGIAIPALPPCSSAFREHVSPGWIGLIEQQAISYVRAAVIRECEEQKRCAQESCRKVPT